MSAESAPDFIAPRIEDLVVPGYPLNRGQIEALDGIQNGTDQGIMSGYLDMATGTGKTRAAAYDVKRYRQGYPEARVLYLCHNTEILAQAREEFTAVLETGSHGNLFGGEYDDQKNTVYATFQTLDRPFGDGKIYQAFDPNEFQYIVVDESHHGPAPTYRRVIDHFKPERLLGTTPTPLRRDQKDMEAIFGQPYYRLTLEEAIARGDLAKPDYRVLTDHVKRLEELGSEIKGLKVNEINSKIFVKKRDAEIGEEIYDHIEDLEDPRMIVFCPSIAYAERMADFVPGIAAPYHSKLPKSEQEKRMRQFKAGKLTTLLAVDKLNEGVDVPEASVLVFLRSTESRTIFLQQLGRGLRKYQGKESVLVLDFVASWERIRDIRLLQERVHGIYSSKPKPIETEAPFKFEFSEEALNAIEVIEFARGATKRPERLTPQKPLVEKWKRDEDELKALLGVESLPNQKLSKHDWQKYTSRILKGDTDAINELLMHRLRTLWGMANKAFKNADNLETTVEDVFQHAYIGAHEGLSKYRAGLGSSLEMMFLISAKRQIDIALSGNSLIKLPFTVAADQAQIKETEQQIAEENSVSHVNPVELSSVLGMDFDKAVALQYYSHAMAYEKLLPISAAESMPDPSPQEELIDEIDFRWMAEFLLDGVLDREKTVLEHRYGLNGKQLMTLDDTGRLLESQNFPDTVITRERVRQIENATLKKLANIAAMNYLTLNSDIRHRTPIVTSMDPNERAVALRLGYKLAPNYSEWGDRTEYKMQIRSLRDELKRSLVKKRRNR